MKKNIILLFLINFFQLIQSQTPFKTGINFPFRNPQTTNLSDFLSRLNETGTTVMRQMTYADVYWNRVEPTNNNWNFISSDSAYFNSYGITPIGELFSIMGENDTIGIQVPWKACSNPITCFWNPTTDSLDTKDYISTVVNRYKSVTSYWEITNEFENVNKPKGLPLLQKRDFLQHSYNWIKQADPNSKVLLPALLGTCGYPFDNSNNWLRGFLNIGGGNSFDIMNYHDYNSWWTLPLHYDSIRTILNNFGYNSKPIWITETSISSSNLSTLTPSYSSIDEQAADVWRRTCLLWAKGAEVAFWHSHWSSGDLTAWGEFGLLNNFGKKKKSFHSYKLLIDKVASFSTISALSYGNITNDNNIGGNGVWSIEFIVNGMKKWLIWSPDNQPYTLNSINSNQISITTVVPTFISSSGDSASFITSNFNVSGGNYTFNNLTSLPILVEEVSNTNLSEFDLDKINILIFPNPFFIQFNLKSNIQLNNATIEIYNSMGQIVKEVNNINGKNITITRGNISSGFYYIKLIQNEKLIWSDKLIIID